MDVTQCIADIDVVTHFDAIKNATVAATIAGTKAAVLQQVTTVTIPDVIKTVTHSYGGPGILLGTTWPIVVATLPIVVWRLITNGSIRSWFLFIAVLFNLADCANVTWARSTPRAELDVNTHFKMAIAFSQLKMAFLASAGAWRFGQVYVKRSTKYGVIWSITVYSERFLVH
ncbi:hypothetical protein BC832DRAFT_354868 [Gaertneriomyces semiglobifer]|nr:hypothetical protein BC832DRAFT_354868 [Gaertneriomyces semiglobifer]